MVDHHGESAPVALTMKVWASDGRLLVSMKRGSTAEVSSLKSTDRSNDRRPVDHADLDRVRADGAGIDVGIARQTRHNAVKRLNAGGVFQLVQADDVGIQTGKCGEEFIALAGEFGSLVAIPTAAFHVIGRTALVIQRISRRVICGDKEVERVHRGNTDGSAHRFRRSRSRVHSSVVCRSGWHDSIQAEVIAQHANRICDGITAAEAVGQARTDSVRVAQEWLGFASQAHRRA